MPETNDTAPGDKDTGVYVTDNFGNRHEVKSDFGKEFLTDAIGLDDNGNIIPGSQASFSDMQTVIQGLYTNDSDLTPDQAADLELFSQMAAFNESGHGDDQYADGTIYDTNLYTSDYLRKKVLPNKLDAYNVPQYVFTLYMLSKPKLTAFYNGGDEEPSSESENSDEARADSSNFKKGSVDRTLTRPAPEDMVIIAQTGTTDIGIDDVEIETYNGPENDIVPTLINFKLTEPGSITLMDRLAEAKRFCGYEVKSPVLLGMFLELEFKGYTDGEDDRDSGGAPITVPFAGSKDQSAVYFELGGIQYDMSMTPEGATYNFSAYRQKSGGKDIRLESSYTISGRNLQELFGGNREDEEKADTTITSSEDADASDTAVKNVAFGLEEAFRKSFASIDDPDKKTDDSGPNSFTRRDFRIDTSSLIQNTAKNEGEGGNPAEEVNLTEDTISNAILKDFALLETFAKSGTRLFKENGKDLNWTDTTDGQDDPTTIDVDETGPITGRQLTDKISIGEASADFTVTETISGTDIYVDPVISITLPVGIHLKDCMYLILTLSEDFVNKAIGYESTDLKKEKPKKVNEAYTRWLSLEGNHYYDPDSYDEKTNTYSEHITVRPILSSTSNPNMVITKSDIQQESEKTIKQLKNKLDQLQIDKEYYYSYTGINTQVLDISLNFDEAFAITVPAIGFGDYAMQSAMATATALKEDEAKNNTQDHSGSATEMAQVQKASNILDTLKELGDEELGGFADYIGFTEEEKKRLIEEKNATGTSIRGSNGTTLEDQEKLKELAANLSVDGIGDAVISGYTTSPYATNPEVSNEDDEDSTPTESDATVLDLRENVDVKSKYIFASALVMGLEGEDQSAWAQRNDGEDAKEFARTGIKPAVKTVPNENIVSEVPDERNSIRQTAMSHLMRAHTNAKSHLMVDMSIRGDTDWLGNDNFYGVQKSEDGRLDFSKRTHDILFVMEAPRRLDNDTKEEDNNTGLFDYGSLNYTISGVYQITHVASVFQGGLFTQTISMYFNTQYEMSKIEQIKKSTETDYSDYYDENGEFIGNKSNAEKGIDALREGMKKKSGGDTTPTSSDLAREEVRERISDTMGSGYSASDKIGQRGPY